jgi:hypothetical protein
MGIGIMVSDYKGGVIATQCATRQFIMDPTMVEALAFRTAVELRHQLGLMDVIFEGDSFEVVQAVRKEEKSCESYGTIVAEAKEMLLWDICHVRRIANEAAHSIAKMVVALNVN